MCRHPFLIKKAGVEGLEMKYYGQSRLGEIAIKLFFKNCFFSEYLERDRN